MSSQQGAVGLVSAGLIAVAVLLALLVVDVAQVVEARARLTSAADAAALAAAPATFHSFGGSGDPTTEAAALAAANGAVLVRCDCEFDHSWARREVVVEVGMHVALTLLGDRRLQAVAAAEFLPTMLGEPLAEP